MMFDYLLARTVYRHEATPGVVYVTGWDDRIQSQVCWAVVNAGPWLSGIEKIRRARIELTLELDRQVTDLWKNDGPPEWLFGMAYVTIGADYYDVTNLLGNVRITPDEYQRIVALAQS